VAEWWSEDEFADVPEGFEEESGLAEEFAAEPLYTYHTALDERVCPQCAPLEGVMFSLDEINEQFPSNENYEDIIFANLHDKCRCQLTRETQPGEVPGGEEEDMVEGRGEPLRRGLGIARFIQRPTLGRGARLLASLLGISGIGTLISLFLFAAMPLINEFIRHQIEMQLREALREEQRKEEQRRKEILKEVLAELDAEKRQEYRSMVP
jgi:hypothetical protein